MASQKNFKVIKKDGSEEEFKSEKIFKALKAVGVSDETAEEIIESVIEKLRKVKSSTLRKIILKQLRKIDKELEHKWKKYDIEHGRVEDSESRLVP